MVAESEAKVSELIDRINAAWLEGRLEDLESCFDRDIVMVLPGFSGRAEGRAAMMAGFEDFCANARILRFRENDRQVDVLHGVAVVSFGFELEFERGDQAYRSAGRDLWVCERRNGRWSAVWRTMLDLTEQPIGTP